MFLIPVYGETTDPDPFVLYFIAGLVLISLHIWACYLFNDAAEKKGYSDRNYGIICFFTGIAGMLLVIALPDRSKQTNPAELPEQDDNGVVCPSCGAANDSESNFCKECGTRLTNNEEPSADDR